MQTHKAKIQTSAEERQSDSQ